MAEFEVRGKLKLIKGGLTSSPWDSLEAVGLTPSAYEHIIREATRKGASDITKLASRRFARMMGVEYSDLITPSKPDPEDPSPNPPAA